MMASMGPKDKRAHRRLQVHLPLEYRREGLGRCNVSRTTTKNVSTGGVYFETTADDFKPGEMLALEVGVPEDDPRFPTHGKIATTGKVVRTVKIDQPVKTGQPSFTRYGVAAVFQEPFRLTF
jgi:hypothetical protein